MDSTRLACSSMGDFLVLLLKPIGEIRFKYVSCLFLVGSKSNASQVTVKNNIKSLAEGTSVHWHGILQKETPWYDGVPSGMLSRV